MIKESIGSITSDRRMQALLIAFAFRSRSSKAVAGLSRYSRRCRRCDDGRPRLLVVLPPSSICLLANTAPGNAFGSIGIPVITLSVITGLPLNQLSASVGRICAPISLFIPAYLILVTSGLPALIEVWPAVLVTGGAFALFQFLISNFIGPQLTDVIASLAAMGGLILLLRFWKPKNVARVKATEESAALAALDTTPRVRPTHTAKEIWLAWMPYGFLVIFVLAWGYQPIVALLNKATIAIPWPGLHNHILRMPPVVAAPAKYGAIFNLNWFSASGTSCMFAAILSAIFCRMSLSTFAAILKSVAITLIKPVITVASMLALAFVMNYSGATGTLGLAFSATGVMFPFFSPLMGWLGVFLTGSDTSANALFGNLQVVSATRLGFSPVLIAAANSAGGVMGKMISLQNIAVAAAATNMPQAEQTRLFRFTLRHSIFLAIVVGIEVMLYTPTCISNPSAQRAASFRKNPYYDSVDRCLC